MKTLFALSLGLALTLSAYGQGQNAATHCIQTNTTADATNRVWTCPWSYAWITFQNDSATNIYFDPGTTFSNITATSTNVITGGVTNTTPYILTNVYTAAAIVGQGIRLNANGGSTFFDNQGRPGTSQNEKNFNFIAQGGNGNNVCIEVGTLITP